MLYPIATYRTESAAFLACARIAANGGPVDVAIERVNGAYRLVYHDRDAAQRSIDILALFSDTKVATR
jgi:hypothetical protein